MISGQIMVRTTSGEAVTVLPRLTTALADAPLAVQLTSAKRAFEAEQ